MKRLLARLLRYLAIIAVTVGGSLMTFVILLSLDRPPWESREHVAIAFWSVPLAFLILAIGKPARHWIRNRSAIFRIAVATIAAIVAAFGWTFVAVALTGGYALAFDANPLICWLVGSLIGTFVLYFWRSTPIEPESPPSPAV